MGTGGPYLLDVLEIVIVAVEEMGVVLLQQRHELPDDFSIDLCFFSHVGDALAKDLAAFRASRTRETTAQFVWHCLVEFAVRSARN